MLCQHTGTICTSRHYTDFICIFEQCSIPDPAKISPTFPYGRNVLSHNFLFDQRTFYDAALFLPTNKVSVLIKMNKRESAVFHGF